MMGLAARIAPCVLLVACGRLGFQNQPAETGGETVDAPITSPPPSDAVMLPIAPSSGLVAHWAFDTWNAMTSPEDVSGNNADCSATTGCPTQVAGVLGNAAQFDGSKACLDVAGLASWADPQFTISAWVKSSSSSGPVVVHESDSGCPSPELVMSNGAGLVQLNVTDTMPHNEAWTLAAIPTPGSWHQVAVSWDGANQAVYVDGVCSCSKAQALGPLDNVQPFTIGCYPTGGPTFFTGSIDDVRIYNRVLSAQEMADVYGAVIGTSPVPQGCTATCGVNSP